MNSTFKKLYHMNERDYNEERIRIMSNLDNLDKLDVAGDYIIQTQRIILIIENALRTSKIKDVYALTDKLYNSLNDDYNKIIDKQTDYLNDMEANVHE